MAAAIRLARWHQGRTGSNPSVATLIVREIDGGPVIIGRGVTAIGGRPHAETQALAEAGEGARGATAFVTLEPCAHHGRTPPCAEALVTAGVARVVAACTDPDDRVSGRGYAILRAAGIEVCEGVLAEAAASDLAGYLARRTKNRPHVILKMAVSADGMIGAEGAGQVPITADIARRQVHSLRSVSDVIMIGSGTALADDPELTCRLPGLEGRSPIRLVLDRTLRLPVASKLARSARSVPLWLATSAQQDDPARAALASLGAEFLAAECHDGRLALPELMEDIAARGASTVLVEGGAVLATSLLDEDLVDRLILFTGAVTVGERGVDAPFALARLPDGFVPVRTMQYGPDRMDEFERQR
ncbi:diaminohydroxyphosphoribosylaminopyrimidine deaminase [Hoeflea marina]|uniref:Riboflavin biosynthesis protein RibD n=1 Tax=Hoeflea marina TaxID=274592 RepID=A0A317PPG9_9HYPH|nr:bifunctional diaminohydroxyphosphoribosylaminopyrimidine deaminase/5-amino-6-(5-phosphoribosylamino)uracil reductase RibD [Hoeflea marina]PWW03421.1 diaminohydroxyphosphoribosylaminopyrimidine deaminase [Hoeflea marina]